MARPAAPRRPRSGALLLSAALLCLARPADADEAPPADDPAPNYLRPALEIGAGLAAASVWYFVDDRNVLDWDYPSTQQRFNGEAWRFDNNTFALNNVWHPLAGAGMCVLARGNPVASGAPLPWMPACKARSGLAICTCWLSRRSITLTVIPERRPPFWVERHPPSGFRATTCVASSSSTTRASVQSP